jgi:acetolactate synthase-1/3 small subunit/acetolactate synthase II small subunit
MMNGRLVIAFRDEEGAVGRIVGLVERRGFELRGIAMSSDLPGDCGATGHKLTLDVAARDASRRLDVLDLQLMRLDGVSQVSTIAAAMESVS